MSNTTRYLLASAGIQATEEEIAAIEATGYPYEVCHLLAYYAREDQARKANSKRATEAMRRRLERSNHGHSEASRLP